MTSAVVIRIAITTVLFAVFVPLAMSVISFTFGAFVAIEHGSHSSAMDAIAATFTQWRSQVGWFYRGALTSALGGAVFSAIFHRLAITGSSFSVKDLRFYLAFFCVGIAYSIFPLYRYRMPELEAPLMFALAAFSGAAIGKALPRSLVPDVALLKGSADG